MLIESVVLHNTDPGHHKEYRMELHQETKGHRVIKRWGPIGRANQQKIDDTSSLSAARRIFDDMRQQKLDKGYYVVSPPSPPVQQAAPKPATAPVPQQKPAAPKKSDATKQMSAALKKLKPAATPVAPTFVEGEVVEDDVAW